MSFKVQSSELRKTSCYLNKPSKHTDAQSSQLNEPESGSSVLPACLDTDKKNKYVPINLMSHNCKPFLVVVPRSQRGVTWCKAVIAGKPQVHFLAPRMV